MMSRTASNTKMAVRATSFAAMLFVAIFAVCGCDSLSEQLKMQVSRVNGNGSGIDSATIAAGLREALQHGSSRAVSELGRDGGFWSRPALRIPVPSNLQKVDAALRRFGQARLADDFTHALNRAAERAVPAAGGIFGDAIRRITLDDALGILRGPPDAATSYFRRHTEAALARSFRPIVADSTRAVGVTAYYKRVVRSAATVGVDTRELDIDDYVTRKTLDGLFQVVADEERRIRADPAARTTELLRKVFR